MPSSLFKFGLLRDDGSTEPMQHGDTYDWESTTGPMRLVIAPSRDHLGVMLDLARCWEGPCWMLYVLTVPLTGALPGRYQAPEPVEHEEVAAFLDQYRAFLTQDGRHELWITSAEGEGTVVYDPHDILFAYGALERYEDRLGMRGIRRGDVPIPAPHCHHYHEAFNDDERSLLANREWLYTPLQAMDER